MAAEAPAAARAAAPAAAAEGAEEAAGTITITIAITTITTTTTTVIIPDRPQAIGRLGPRASPADSRANGSVIGRTRPARLLPVVRLSPAIGSKVLPSAYRTCVSASPSA